MGAIRLEKHQLAPLTHIKCLELCYSAQRLLNLSMEGPDFSSRHPGGVWGWVSKNPPGCWRAPSIRIGASGSPEISQAEVDTLEAEVKKLKEDRLAEEETLKAFRPEDPKSLPVWKRGVVFKGKGTEDFHSGGLAF